MNALVENPRAVIGGNNPPTAIDLAQPHVDDLRVFLDNNPVLTSEDESRAAKEVYDRVHKALGAMERERKALVEPLKSQAKAIDDKYNRFHNARGTGFWDNLLGALKSRMTAYAVQEERKRHEAEEAARQAAAEAAERARAAAEAEAQAREEAASGVCDVDLAGAIQEARETSQEAMRANWTARRAEGQTKVRITGGSGNAISLRDHEILTVTDWKAAIEEMCDSAGNPPKVIADAILRAARDYRRVTEQLPSGIAATFERGL